MHILPSRGRPDKLQRFFDEGKPEQPGLVVLERDQVGLYSGIRLPAGWRVIVVEDRNGYVAAANTAFRAYPDEPCYQMASDDCVGRTPHWDTQLADAAVSNKVVWPNDLFHGKCTFPCVGGDLCRAFGWFVPPTLWHMYADTFWGDVQALLGTGGYREDVVLEHMHYVNGKAEFDATYSGRMPPRRGPRVLGQEPQDRDKIEYSKILAMLPAYVEKMRQCL